MWGASSYGVPSLSASSVAVCVSFSYVTNSLGGILVCVTWCTTERLTSFFLTLKQQNVHIYITASFVIDKSMLLDECICTLLLSQVDLMALQWRLLMY